MTYSQVVNALYGLSKQKKLEATMEIQVNALAKQIAKVDQAGDGFERPETGPGRRRPGEVESGSPDPAEVGAGDSKKPDAVASSRERSNFFNPFAKSEEKARDETPE